MFDWQTEADEALEKVKLLLKYKPRLQKGMQAGEQKTIGLDYIKRGYNQRASLYRHIRDLKEVWSDLQDCEINNDMEGFAKHKKLGMDLQEKIIVDCHRIWLTDMKFTEFRISNNIVDIRNAEDDELFQEFEYDPDED